jgi:hypothetical protein
LRERTRADAAEILAAQAEDAGLSSLGKLVRAGAKFGIMTIIAAIISGPLPTRKMVSSGVMSVVVGYPFGYAEARYPRDCSND